MENKNTFPGSVPAEGPETVPAAKSKNAEVIRVVKFVLFSASAGIIEMGTFALLNETLHLDYWLSYMIALVLSVEASSLTRISMGKLTRCIRKPSSVSRR